LGILVAAGLLALIGWQASPWLMPGRQASDSTEGSAAAKKEPPVTAAPPVSVPTPAPAPVDPNDAKPSPLGSGQTPPEAAQALPPLKSEPEPVKPIEPSPKIEHRPPVAARPGAPQEVLLSSSPAGATATLDGSRSLSCNTPCSVFAAPGRHTLAMTLDGYHIEQRDFTVGTSPLELTPVELQPVVGTLWLTSIPDQAAISVNGKRIDQLTPARIPLRPGVYSIMVEKGGRQVTEQVEITNGIVTRRLTLGQ
jgi:hypothetical protein